MNFKTKKNKMKSLKINGVIHTLLCILVILIGSCSDSDSENENTYLDINTDHILLKDEGGTAYLNIASNTKWTIFVDNEDAPVENMNVTPLSGNGDETINITYGSVQNKYPHEYAKLIFYYYSKGERVSKEVILSREEQPDDDPYISSYIVVKYDCGNFVTMDGYTLKFNSSESFVGEIYYILYQYKESQVNWENKTAEIKLLENQCIDASVHIGNIEEYASNASVIGIGNVLGSYLTPVFYDENILILPVEFYVREDIKKHTFELIYDPNSNQGNTLRLNLRHIDSEDQNQTLLTEIYQAFDLKSILSSYGKKPDKIIIEYLKNERNNNLESAVKAVQTLNYPF